MAFVATSSPKVPANRQYPVASRASGDGPDTAQYSLVWPNEWPNGEIHARDDERARGARDGRDRSYRHGVLVIGAGPASGRFTEAMSDRERLLMLGAGGRSMEIVSRSEEQDHGPK